MHHELIGRTGLWFHGIYLQRRTPAGSIGSVGNPPRFAHERCSIGCLRFWVLVIEVSTEIAGLGRFLGVMMLLLDAEMLYYVGTTLCWRPGVDTNLQQTSGGWWWLK